MNGALLNNVNRSLSMMLQCTYKMKFVSRNSSTVLRLLSTKRNETQHTVLNSLPKKGKQQYGRKSPSFVLKIHEQTKKPSASSRMVMPTTTPGIVDKKEANFQASFSSSLSNAAIEVFRHNPMKYPFTTQSALQPEAHDMIDIKVIDPSMQQILIINKLISNVRGQELWNSSQDSSNKPSITCSSEINCKEDIFQLDKSCCLWFSKCNLKFNDKHLKIG